MQATFRAVNATVQCLSVGVSVRVLVTSQNSTKTVKK